MRLPDSERGVDRGRDPAVAAAAAQDGRVHVVRVVGVDRQAGRRDAEEEVTRDVGPGSAAVRRPEDAVAEVAVTGQRAFARAGVDDVVVLGGDSESADRGRGKVVGPGRPCLARGVPQPDAALRRAEDERAVLADRQRADAAALRGERAVTSLDLDDRVWSEGRPVAGEGGRSGGRRVLQHPGLVGRRLAKGNRLVDAERSAPGEAPADERLVAQQQLRLQLVVLLRDHRARGQRGRVLACGRSRRRGRVRKARSSRRKRHGESDNECAERTPTTLPHLPSPHDYPSARVRTFQNSEFSTAIEISGFVMKQ